MAPSLPHKIYNVAAGVARSNGDLAAAVKQAVPGAEINLQPGHSARYRPNSYLDIALITQDVGYKPQYTLETGVADYIAWLRHYPQ